MDGGAQVLDFPPPRNELQARLEAEQLARVVAESNADLQEMQANRLGMCLQSSLSATRMHLIGMNTVLIGLDERYADRFNLNGELLALHNYAANFLNRIREVYGLDRIQMPDIPAELEKRAQVCAHPDVCTCRQCKDHDQTVPSHLEADGAL